MSRPISRSLLVHGATLAPYTGTVNSVKQYGTAVTLTHVRMQPVKQTAMTSLGDMKNDKFLMFFDCKNSAPSGTTFKTLDKITFGGQVLAARMVTPCYGDSPDVHHYEVSLV